jgi:uncharacterized protein
VKWTRGTQNDDVVDVRGASSPAGTGLKVGGGVGVAVVVVVIVGRLLGVDLSGLLGGGGGGQPTSHESQPKQGTDEDKELVDFVNFVMKDIQDTFQGMYQKQGKQYRRAKLYLFSRAIDTGCGRSSSAIGPFYCPPDYAAYIDLTFYRDLRDRFKAAGDFAQAYVLAHEIGHHLQKLSGTEAKAQALGRDRKSRNSASVRQELQADCFAGVWGHSASERKLLEMGDLEEALNAASQIGDDRLQKQAGRDVNPETFTHGTSEQRMRWFKRGFVTGRLEDCDTFAAGEL